MQKIRLLSFRGGCVLGLDEVNASRFGLDIFRS